MARKSGRSRKHKGSSSQRRKNYDANETLTRLDSLQQRTKIQQKKDIIPSAGTPTSYIVGIIAILIVGGIAGVLLLGNIGGPPTNNNIDPITTEFKDACLSSHSVTAAHYHITLQLYIDNVIQNIPVNTGVSNNCLHLMHTHANIINRIHIEPTSAFVSHQATITDFFEIWRLQDLKATFGNGTLLGEIGTMTATVKGISNSAIWDYILVEDDIVNIFLFTA